MSETQHGMPIPFNSPWGWTRGVRPECNGANISSLRRAETSRHPPPDQVTHHCTNASRGQATSQCLLPPSCDGTCYDSYQSASAGTSYGPDERFTLLLSLLAFFWHFDLFHFFNLIRQLLL
jgi:hypothetical protein